LTLDVEQLSRRTPDEEIIVHVISKLVRTDYLVSVCEVVRRGNVNKLKDPTGQYKAPDPDKAPLRVLSRPECKRQALKGREAFVIKLGSEDDLIDYPPNYQQLVSIGYEFGFMLLEKNSQLSDEEYKRNPWVVRLDHAVRIYPIKGNKAAGIKKGTGIEVMFARLCNPE
jgi:hypothetical protein